jgi:hypothetical protein
MNRRRIGWRAVLLTAGLMLSLSAVPQEWNVDWHTVDGGGEVLAETDDGQWRLSGTIGQWDSTESLELAGTGWTLTGGFWPATVDQTNVLFRDGFEN